MKLKKVTTEFEDSIFTSFSKKEEFIQFSSIDKSLLSNKKAMFSV